MTNSSTGGSYFTSIDFNAVDTRFHLPEKVIFTKALIITFKGKYILMSMEIDVNNCFVIWLFNYK